MRGIFCWMVGTWLVCARAFAFVRMAVAWRMSREHALPPFVRGEACAPERSPFTDRHHLWVQEVDIYIRGAEDMGEPTKPNRRFPCIEGIPVLFSPKVCLLKLLFDPARDYPHCNTVCLSPDACCLHLFRCTWSFAARFSCSLATRSAPTLPPTTSSRGWCCGAPRYSQRDRVDRDPSPILWENRGSFVPEVPLKCGGYRLLHHRAHEVPLSLCMEIRQLKEQLLRPLLLTRVNLVFA